MSCATELVDDDIGARRGRYMNAGMAVETHVPAIARHDLAPSVKLFRPAARIGGCADAPRSDHVTSDRKQP